MDKLAATGRDFIAQASMARLLHTTSIPPSPGSLAWDLLSGGLAGPKSPQLLSLLSASFRATFAARLPTQPPASSAPTPQGHLRRTKARPAPANPFQGDPAAEAPGSFPGRLAGGGGSAAPPRCSVVPSRNTQTPERHPELKQPSSTG